jgi:hypothetical protein
LFFQGLEAANIGFMFKFPTGFENGVRIFPKVWKNGPAFFYSACPPETPDKDGLRNGELIL